MESSLLLKFRQDNSPNGINRDTLKRLAASLGVSETMAIHMALAEMARKNLPYEADDGSLTEDQIRSIQAVADRHLPKGKLIKKTSLF